MFVVYGVRCSSSVSTPCKDLKKYSSATKKQCQTYFSKLETTADNGIYTGTSARHGAFTLVNRWCGDTKVYFVLIEWTTTENANLYFELSSFLSPENSS